MAQGQVQYSSTARIQTVALLQLGAGFREASFRHQRATILEQHGGEGLVVGVPISATESRLAKEGQYQQRR